MIKLSGKDVTFGENTVSQSGQRMLTRSGIRDKSLSGSRTTGFHWNGHRFPPPTSGSVLYMPGYPAQGSTIQDFSGSGNNGTITGAIWKRLPSGLWYLDYDGSDDKVTISGFTRPTTSMTVITWAFSETQSENEPLLSAFETGNEELFIFRITIGGKLYVALRQSDHTLVDNSFVDVVTYDKWEMFSFVASAALGTFRVYINGTLDSGTDTYDGTLNDDGTDPLLIAARSGNRFKGGQTLQRISNLALSATQIAGIFNQERHLFGV